MKINPLAVFTGLTLVTFAALLYVEQKGGADERLITTAKVEPLAVPEAPKPAEPVKVEPTPVTKVEPAPSPPPPATEVAKIEEPAAIEPPKAAEPAKPAETAKIIPSFDTVRVEPTGEALIAGRAEPGSEVVVKFNGMTVGTAMTNADGAFVVTPDKPLPSGPGALSIESKSNEIVIASADSVAVDVKVGAVDTPLVAVLKPDEPTKVIQAPSAPKPALPPSKTVSLDTVDYDQTGNIVFGGHGPAGNKVQLYVDNNAYGLADINDKGTWSFAGLSPLTVGPHALRADEIGGNGAVKSRIEMPFYREEPTRVAAAPVAAAPAPAHPVEVAEVEVAPAVATSTTEAATTTTEAAATTTEAPETTTAEAPATTTTEVVKAPEPVPEAPANVEAPAEAPVVVAAQVPAAAEAAAAPTQVIIQPGNNLWKLSRQIYGRGMMYTVIYEANKDQIRKPSLIYPGQIFLTPEAAAATTGQ
jgi:LysM domain